MVSIIVVIGVRDGIDRGAGRYSFIMCVVMTSWTILIVWMNHLELSLDVANDTIISTDMLTMIGWALNHFLDNATMHIYDDDGAF